MHRCSRVSSDNSRPSVWSPVRSTATGRENGPAQRPRFPETTPATSHHHPPPHSRTGQVEEGKVRALTTGNAGADLRLCKGGPVVGVAHSVAIAVTDAVAHGVAVVVALGVRAVPALPQGARSAGLPRRLSARRSPSHGPTPRVGPERKASAAPPNFPRPPATTPTTTAGQTRRTRGSLSTHHPKTGV